MVYIKKVIRVTLTLMAISFLTFFLVKLAPGDPAENYLRASHVAVTDATLAAAREQLGLNQPFAQQYWHWLVNVLQGNFGVSYLKKEAVSTLIAKASVATFQLGVISFVLLCLLSYSFGILSAFKCGKWIDYVIQLCSFVSISIPTFWLGYMLIIVFAVTFKWFPVSGKSSFASIVLPCAALVIPLIGQSTLIVRKIIVELQCERHVQNAILAGVSLRYLLQNHFMRNSAAAIVTLYSANILYLMTGSILIEEVFAWPGMGQLFVTAVKGGDLPVIQGFLLLFGVLTIGLNAMTNWFVRRLDPNFRV